MQEAQQVPLRVVVLSHPEMKHNYSVFVNGMLCRYLCSSSRQVWIQRELGIVVKIGDQSRWEALYWETVPSHKRKHFAAVLAWGETQDGTFWSVMPFINGTKDHDGSSYCEARDLFTSLGVSDVHEENYLLTSDGPIIIDYGIPQFEPMHDLRKKAAHAVAV